MKPNILAAVLLSIAVAPVAAHVNPGYTMKYRVTVKADKHTDFSQIRTYAWMPTQPSDIPQIDERVIAAVDRELAGLGMTKAPESSCDVLATYLSLNRTDVNVNAKKISGKKGDSWPEYAVGTLVVSLLDPKTLDPLLRIRADKRIEADARLASAIDGAVAEMFRKYPTRTKSSRP